MKKLAKRIFGLVFAAVFGVMLFSFPSYADGDFKDFIDTLMGTGGTDHEKKEQQENDPADF